MNIIRTKAVELTAIPAIAYKQKLSTGGAGVRILRMDLDATAVVTINKRDGSWVPYGKIDEKLFPDKAIDEAVEMTAGLPYSARGAIKVSPVEIKEEEDVTVDAPVEQIDMTLSAEYQALVKYYSDDRGKLNYQLMNRDFIKFADKSKTVSDMVKELKSRDEIVNYIVRNRVGYLLNSKDSIDEKAAELLIETLDEIDPRSAFKELKAHLNRLSGKNSAKSVRK